MSNLDKLIAVGAQCVGGDLLWKHKVLGSFRNGDFHISAAGEQVLAQDITDVEVKAEVTKAKPARKKSQVEPMTDDTDIFDTLMDLE